MLWQGLVFNHNIISAMFLGWLNSMSALWRKIWFGHQVFSGCSQEGLKDRGKKGVRFFIWTCVWFCLRGGGCPISKIFEYRAQWCKAEAECWANILNNSLCFSVNVSASFPWSTGQISDLLTAELNHGDTIYKRGVQMSF